MTAVAITWRSALMAAASLCQRAPAFIALLSSSSSWSQLLAVFRFLCLQLGYAAFRLRHWWVVAVSVPQTHTHTGGRRRPSPAVSRRLLR